MTEKKTAGLSEHLADKLLELLGGSDEFRDLFQKDPQAALQQVGYMAPGEVLDATSPEATPSSIAGCCSVQQLAPKDAIRAAHSELKTMLLSGLSQTTPGLDAKYSD